MANRSITISVTALRRIVQEAYEEGKWRSEYGSLTGCPYYDIRSPLNVDETFTALLEQVHKKEKIGLPERKTENLGFE